MTSRVIEALKALNFSSFSDDADEGNFYVISSTLYGMKMTTRQIERIIGDAAKWTIGRVITPHMLRHTYATRLLKVTDTRTLQTLMGHKHLSSTQIYTHVNTDDRIMAVEAMQKRFLNSRGSGSVSQ